MSLLQQIPIVLAALLLNAGLCAQSYFVSPSGSDGNAGTFAAPWKTFQHACNSATPGSTVYLRAGTYAPAELNVGGTSGNFITFTNHASELAVIDGGSTGTQTELLVISGKNYIRVQNLVFANAVGNFSSGIYITNGSHHIEVLGNTIHNINFSNDPNEEVADTTSAFPLIVYNEHPSNACHHLLLSGNEIYNCRTGYSEALSMGGNVDGFEVSGNVVHDNTNIGIDLTGGYAVSSNPATDMARNGLVCDNLVYNCTSEYADVAAGIYVDGGQNIIVERNISHHNGRGFEIGCEPFGHETTNIILRNNIAYLNEQPGIGIGGYDYPSNTGKVTNCQILNNTFYANNTDNIYDGELLVEYTENCTLKHNIFYAANTQKILMVTRLNSSGLVLDYNLFYHPDGAAAAVVDWEGDNGPGFANYQNTSGQDANSLFADPDFANAAGYDFAPSLGSPAINSGSPGMLPDVGETDFALNPRTVGARIDMGAYEYAGQCLANLNLTSPISGMAFHRAQGNITATNTIAPTADVTYTAGNAIFLNVGFEVQPGAKFYAAIEGCD